MLGGIASPPATLGNMAMYAPALNSTQTWASPKTHDNRTSRQPTNLSKGFINEGAWDYFMRVCGLAAGEGNLGVERRYR
jgi:hypothetical protein